MNDRYFTNYFTDNDKPEHLVYPRFIHDYGTLPIKCPFCGYRQNIWKDGANCKKCGGDVLNDKVK